MHFRERSNVNIGKEINVRRIVRDLLSSALLLFLAVARDIRIRKYEHTFVKIPILQRTR